jgi:hypothetical protein
MPEETYIGDGLYASFDGYQFCLRAPRSVGFGDHMVFLEPDVLEKFLRFVGRNFRISEKTLAVLREDPDKGEL